MKNYIFKTSVFALLLVFFSCEDFLEETNYSNLTGDSYFATEQGIESLVKGCYTPLRFYYGKEHSLVFTELGTDIFTAGNGMVQNPYTYYRSDMVRMAFKGVGDDKNADYWRYFYLGLNNANAAVARVPESPLPSGLRKIREGEVLYLRAFYLWHIVNIWGGVHFTTEETTEASTNLNMTDESKFHEQIIEDLRRAIPLLPVSSDEYGRVTKPAAQALLARTYLYTEDYSNASAYADTVINDYSFELLEDFSALWDANNDINDEVIWSVVWSENDLYSATIIEGQQDKDGEEWFERAPGNQLHLFYTMIYQEVSINRQIPVIRDLENGRSFNRFVPTQYMVDLYDNTMDERYDGTFQSVWYANTAVYPDSTDINGDTVFVNNNPIFSKIPMVNIGDTAILVTRDEIPDNLKKEKPYAIIDRSDLFEANGGPVEPRIHTFTMRKFLDPTRDPADVGDQSSKLDIYVFRLAEMYFIAAESQMNLNNNDKAAEYINVVRRRAAKSGMETQMEVTGGDITLDFILDEKAREFAGEYIRWFDLKRTNKLVERVKLHNTDAAPNIQPYHRNRPIPQSELDAVTNKTVFHQWDGYN